MLFMGILYTFKSRISIILTPVLYLTLILALVLLSRNIFNLSGNDDKWEILGAILSFHRTIGVQCNRQKATNTQNTQQERWEKKSIH